VAACETKIGQKKRRLLFVRRATEFGGSEIVILELLKAIDYGTTAVSVASSVDVFSGLVAELGLPVNCLPLTAPFTGGFVRMLIGWILYLRRLRPDKIVLAEGGFRDFPLSTALAAFAIARGNLWMMELHPAPAPAENKLNERRGFMHMLRLPESIRGRLARGILSVSHGVKERLVLGYGYAPEKIDVVYNGVDTKRFSPTSESVRKALRRKLRVPDDANVIVSTARLATIKRLDRLIQAFGALSATRRDLLLLLTGEGPLREELRNFAALVERPEAIRFLGHVEDVCEILRVSDVYVLPSDEEGFGIALAEAMACQLLCVATKTAGPSEIIEDGVNGFLVEPTYEGVLTGLDRALGLDEQSRQAFGNRARQRIVENFRVEESAAKGLAFMEISLGTKVVQ
jgi:glycosyltransferase involved in cell wall biosynthesis